MSASTVQLQQSTIRQYTLQLRLPTIGGQFLKMAEEAVKQKQAHVAYLEALLAAEVEERERNAITRRIQEAKFPKVKTLEDFHFQEATHIPAAQIRNLAEGGYPNAKTVHLVMDNLNIHRCKSLSDVFGSEMATEVWDRFTVHYTPTHGSWLNQAEIEIGIFSRQCLGTRRIPDVTILRREARAWNRRMNCDRVHINWKFDRKAARRKFGYKRKSFTQSQT